ncbi:MAG: hypothetical protein O3C28_19285 [Proteobacteria bacterium]|nr:hypothetical protein [Pseudomonadota bacterium]
MRAGSLVERLITEVTPGTHEYRRSLLVAAITSALDGSSLSVMALGRGINGPAYEKHRIKRAERLLSNRHLQSERLGIYSAVTQRLLIGITRPLISVD